MQKTPRVHDSALWRFRAPTRTRPQGFWRLNKLEDTEEWLHESHQSECARMSDREESVPDQRPAAPNNSFGFLRVPGKHAPHPVAHGVHGASSLPLAARLAGTRLAGEQLARKLCRRPLRAASGGASGAPGSSLRPSRILVDFSDGCSRDPSRALPPRT